MWNRSGLVGGFITRELTFQQTPRALVSGDGQVFSPGAQIEIYPGPMLPADLDARLADASSCTVVPAAEVGETLLAATQLTFFTDGDVTYQVLAKPILPGTTCG